MSYLTDNEARTVLGLSASITAEEQSVLNLIRPLAHGAVKSHLKYDPEQASHVEFLPRRDNASLMSGSTSRWNVNPQHTRAVLEIPSSMLRTLQLTHIPVRSVSEVLVDSTARHGTSQGSFGSGTEWTEGEDFHTEFDQPGVCFSGQLFAVGSWTANPGSIKVTYYGGYSPDELAGQATQDKVESGIVTTKGIDASPIKQALILTMTKAFITQMNYKKKGSLGFASGAIKSEKLGDYSYALSDASSAVVGGMAISIPPEAEELLETFMHYGLMRL